MTKLGAQTMIELRKYTHEDRLRIGREISNHIISKHGDDVLAIFICGSTAKKLDRPYSDLELIIVVKDGIEIPAKYYLYHGIVIEVDYSQETNLLKRASNINRNWPIEADQYRNRITLFDREGWLEKLQNAVENSDRSETREALQAAAVGLTEDIAFLLNAQTAGDTMGIIAGGHSIASDAAALVLLLNREYVKTTSWFWKQAFGCAERPAEFESFVKTSGGFVSASPEEVATAAMRLYDDVTKLVAARGISIESEELIV